MPSVTLLPESFHGDCLPPHVPCCGDVPTRGPAVVAAERRARCRVGERWGTRLNAATVRAIREGYGTVCSYDLPVPRDLRGSRTEARIARNERERVVHSQSRLFVQPAALAVCNSGLRR